MKRWVYNIAATVILITLSACGASAPNEKQLVEDLQAQAFSEQFAVQTISDLETYELLPYAITDLEIDKRDTIDADDTVWFSFTADNSAIEYQGTGTAYYHKYTEGGWQLDSFSVDTQTSKPISAPTEVDCILAWDNSWAWYGQDIDSAEFEIKDVDLNAVTPTAILQYSGVLTDGGISHLTGTFEIPLEYYDGIGWKSTGTMESANSSMYFDEDLVGTYHGYYQRYSNDRYFVVREIDADGTIYGHMGDTRVLIDYSENSRISYDEFGAYMCISLDTSDPDYWQGAGEDYLFQIQTDGLISDKIFDIEKIY